MNKRVRIEFMEREYFSEDRSGKYIKGYEPAVIDVDGEKKVGRIIDVNRLRQAQYLETTFFRCEIPYSETRISLEELIGKNEEGRKWLELLVKMHSDCYGMTINTEFHINPLQMIPIVYTVYKENLEQPSQNCKPSDGLIVKLPQGAAYARIIPPMYFADGTPIKNLYYTRNAIFPDKNVFSASMRDFCNLEDLRQAEGVLIGELNYYDVEAHFLHGGDTFHVLDFPIISFLKVSYPVSFRDRDHNPLSIRIWLTVD